MKGCVQQIIQKILRRGCAIFGVDMRRGDLSKVCRGRPSALAKVDFVAPGRGCKTQKPPDAEGTTKYIVIENYTPYCLINKGHSELLRGG